MAYKQKKSPLKIVGFAGALPIIAGLGFLENKGYTDFIETKDEKSEKEEIAKNREKEMKAAADKASIQMYQGTALSDMKKNMYKPEDTTGFFASDDYGKSTSDPSAKLKSVYRMKGNPMKRNFPKHIKK